MKVVRRQQEEPTLDSKDWQWLVWGVIGAAVVCLIVGWVATRAGASSRPAPVASAAAAPIPPAPLPAAEEAAVSPVQGDRPADPAERAIPHYEAVRMTVENLREHARRDPNAPDVLSEARIKAIQARGAVIN